MSDNRDQESRRIIYGIDPDDGSLIVVAASVIPQLTL